MESESNINKEYEFVKYLEGLNLKIFISCLISFSKTLFHWHKEIEIMLVVDGPVTIYTENAQFQLETDDIFIINPNEVHCIQKKKEMNSALIIQVAPNFCNTYFPELKRIRFSDRHFKKNGPGEKIWKMMFGYVLQMVDSLSTRESGFQFRVMSKMNMIFYDLFEYSDHERVSENKRVLESRNMKRLNRIISYIQENFAYKITLTDIAEMEGLDMYYLSHFIKKYIGMSFQQYLNKLRLAKAVDLLMNTNNRNIDICYESGFSDYRYLSKAFLNEFGCTPAQYKEQYREQYAVAKNNIPDESLHDQYIILNEEETYKRFYEYINRRGLADIANSPCGE